MEVTIVYTDGVFEFTVEKPDGYVDSFEASSLHEAKEAVAGLLKEMEDEYDPLDEVFREDEDR